MKLADGRYFALHRLDGEPDATLRRDYAGSLLVVPREGAVAIDGESLAPGSCGHAAGIDRVRFASGGQCLIARPK